MLTMLHFIHNNRCRYKKIKDVFPLIAILIFIAFTSITKHVGAFPSTLPLDIQPLDADTLHFYNETEFHDFLEYHGLKYYTVMPPAIEFECSESATADIYDGPKYAFDYLHEELFADFPFTILVDHYGTRKVIETLLPSLGDPEANVCDVNLYITHPTTGQVVVFYDEFNWIDENGVNIFNANKKLYWLWGYDAGTITFPITAVQEGTEYDFTFPDIIPEATLKLNFDTITIYTQYPYYPDNDNDGYGDNAGELYAYIWMPPAGYVTNNTDCDDSEIYINTGALEICNGKDDNCDGTMDEGFTFNTYFMDADGDNFGNPLLDSLHCAIPTDFVSDNLDCDDSNGSVFPGAPEIADGLDNNCNDAVDEGVLDISEMESELVIQVFPNPNYNMLNVQIQTTAYIHTELSIVISNSQGAEVYQEQIFIPGVISTHQVNLELPEGVYIIKIGPSGKQSAQQLIYIIK